jgi:hypothetical protein
MCAVKWEVNFMWGGEAAEITNPSLLTAFFVDISPLMI